MALIKHSQRTLRKSCSKCGSNDLYWAHDSEGTPSKSGHYCSEHSSANWTRINRDGTRHDCNGNGDHGPEDGEVAPAVPAPWPLAKPEAPLPAPVTPAPVTPEPAAPVPAATDPAMAAFQAFMAAVAPKVDATQVQAIIDERLRGLVLPVRVEVTRNGETKPVEGMSHKVLPDVIDILMDGDSVFMAGPAGTGKSHIAAQAAEALGVEAYSISLTPQTPASLITGYQTATGDYVRTAFRDAYENGGVFCFDEVDNGHASTLGIVNSALSNGSMAFPDGKVKRHDDFRCVATANTYGRGPDRTYVGRQALDGAFLDRFEVIDVEYDLALEEALCLATGLDSTRVKGVLAYVRHLRTMAETYKMPISFGSRRSRALCKRLARGWKADKAIKSAVRRGISDADWRKLSDGAPSI